MYVGTPLATNANSVGYTEELGATNYSECVRLETDSSFGQEKKMIEDTAEDELRSIAKYCATEFYGEYFEGKNYTTREEMLMLLFTIFDEDVGIPGYFQDGRFVFEGDELDVPYENISGQAWYVQYITLAYDLMMTEDEEVWKMGIEVSNADILNMLSRYLESIGSDSVNEVTTQYGSYQIYWEDGKLLIEKK